MTESNNLRPRAESCACLWAALFILSQMVTGSGCEGENLWNMSAAAALTALYNSNQLLFVVAERWWSMCSCGGRVLYNVNGSKTRARERNWVLLYATKCLCPSWSREIQNIPDFLCERSRAGGEPEVKLREGKATSERHHLHHHHHHPSPQTAALAYTAFHKCFTRFITDQSEKWCLSQAQTRTCEHFTPKSRTCDQCERCVPYLDTSLCLMAACRPTRCILPPTVWECTQLYPRSERQQQHLNLRLNVVCAG